MYTITDGTPIAALTVGQFKELFYTPPQPQPAPEVNQQTPTAERKTLYSIRELAEFIGCSTPTAHKFKKSGRIPCRQIGRKVLFDTVDVLNAMDQTKKTRKR
jgi:excisionase family DNA binding protein